MTKPIPVPFCGQARDSVEVPGLQRIAYHKLLESLRCHVRPKRLHNAYSSGLYHEKSRHSHRQRRHGDTSAYLEITSKANIVNVSTAFWEEIQPRSHEIYSSDLPELVLFTP